MTITDKADIKVHLQQPIKNVYRVAVKSFTMANALFNIRSGENTLDWVEYVNTEFGYKSKAFQVIIPQLGITQPNSSVPPILTRKFSR